MPDSSLPIGDGAGGAGGDSTEGARARDEDINITDTSTPTHNQISGLITRSHVHQLNYQVTSFLASYSSYLDNGNVHSLMLLRNDR
jgi:hypothetical protein